MDIIKLASDALKPISDGGIPVQQGWYDESIGKVHVTLWSLGDYEGGHSDDAEEVEVGPGEHMVRERPGFHEGEDQEADEEGRVLLHGRER